MDLPEAQTAESHLSALQAAKRQVGKPQYRHQSLYSNVREGKWQPKGIPSRPWIEQPMQFNSEPQAARSATDDESLKASPVPRKPSAELDSGA